MRSGNTSNVLISATVTILMLAVAFSPMIVVAANPAANVSVLEPGGTYNVSPATAIVSSGNMTFYTPGYDHTSVGKVDIQYYPYQLQPWTTYADSTMMNAWLIQNLMDPGTSTSQEGLIIHETVNGIYGWGGVNYTGSTNMTLTTFNPDYFPTIKLEPIPTPVPVSNGTSPAPYILLSWTGLLENIEDSWVDDLAVGWTGSTSNIVSYSVFRSTDNISFTRMGNSTAQVKGGAVYFNDTAVGTNMDYYYRVAVNYRYPVNNGGNAIDENLVVPANTQFPGIYVTTGQSDASQAVEVFDPAIDYVVIMDANDGSGAWIGDTAMTAGQTLTMYANGFNGTAPTGTFVSTVNGGWTTTGTLDLQTAVGTDTFTFSPTTAPAWGTAEFDSVGIPATPDNATGNITVGPTTPNYVLITPDPQSMPAGTASTFTITSYDIYGNIAPVSADTTFTLTENSPTGQFNQTATAVPIGSVDILNGTGNATFDYYDTTNGTWMILASNAGFVDDFANVTVRHLGLNSFTVVESTLAPNVPQPAWLNITALDIFGNTVLDHNGADTLTQQNATDPLQLTWGPPADVTPSGDGNATLNAGAWNNGVANIRLNYSIAGNGVNVTVLNTTSAISGTSQDIVWQIGGLDHFFIVVEDTAPTVGSPVWINITAKDPGNNTIITYASADNLLSIGDSGPFLPFWAGDAIDLGNGDATANLASWIDGTLNVTLVYNNSDDPVTPRIDTGSVQTDGAAITWQDGPVVEFLLAVSDTAPTAGTATTITITAIDLYGNIVQTYDEDCSITQNGGGAAAALGTNGANGQIDVGEWTNGVTSFTATYNTAYDPMNFTIANNATGNPSNNTLNITWLPDMLNWFNVSENTTAPAVGTEAMMTVVAMDQYNNIIITYNQLTSVAQAGANTPANLVFTGTGVVGTGPGTAQIQAAGWTNGVAYVNVNYNVAGDPTAFDYSRGLVTSSSSPITWQASGIDHYYIVESDLSPIAGYNTMLTIEAKDNFNNTITTYNGVTSLAQAGASTAASIVYSGASITDFGNGNSQIEMLGWTLGVAFVNISYTVAYEPVTFTIGGLNTSQAITWLPDILDSYYITADTTSPVAGMPATLTITAKDQYNNTKMNYTDNVELLQLGASVPANIQWSGAGVTDDADGTGWVNTWVSGVAVVQIVYNIAGEPVVVQLNDGSISSNSPAITWIPDNLDYILVEDMAGVEAGDMPALTTDNNVKFFSQGYDQFDNYIGNITVDWGVTGGIGVLNATNGISTELDCTTPGTGVVLAYIDGLFSDITGNLTVGLGALDSIMITPNPATVINGNNQGFTAVGYDADGNIVPANPLWSVAGGIGTAPAGPGLATTFTATAIGTGWVNATDGAVTGSADVTVIPVGILSIAYESGDGQTGTVNTGLPLILVVNVTDDSGLPVAGQTIVWTIISAPAGSTMEFLTANASFTGANGLAASQLHLGEMAGVYQVQAELLGVGTYTFNLNANPDALFQIVITPNTATIIDGGSQVFNAAGFDQYGNSVATNPTWSVAGGIGNAPAGPGLATTFTATSVGTGWVNATDGIVTASADVTVTIGPAANLNYVSGQNQTRTVNNNLAQNFVVSVTDGQGNPVPGVMIVWTITGIPAGSTLESLAAVTSLTNGTGEASVLFRIGEIVGMYTVDATVSGLAGSPYSFYSNATADILATITVAPNSLVIIDGGNQAFNAAGFDQYGNTVAINPAWSVVGGIGNAAPAVGTATTFTAAAVGNGWLNATVGPVTGSATVTVINGAAANLAYVNGTGQTQVVDTTLNWDFVVKVTDSLGNPIQGVNVAWTVYQKPVGSTVESTSTVLSMTDAEGNASVSFGLGEIIGMYAVNATVLGVAGSPVTFFANATADAIANIVVTPGPITLANGSNQGFTAAGFDQFGNPIVINPTWSVDGGIGTVLPLVGAATTFTTTNNGIGWVNATDSIVGSAAVTVISAGLDYIIIEYANGTTVEDYTMTVDNTLDVYAMGYNFTYGQVGPFPVDWNTTGFLDRQWSNGTTNFTFDPSTAGTYGRFVINYSADPTVYTIETGVITVNPGALAYVVITPAGQNITADGTLQFIATGYDAEGNTIGPAAVTWGAENGTISGTGLLTPWAVGTWNISATGAANVTVNVTVGALASLTISPADTTITTDVTQPYSVNGFDAKGNPVTVNPASVTWDVQNGGIVGGLFTPDEVGIWAVYAVVNNIMGTTTVNVTIGVLIFEVNPTGQTITADGDLQFTAIARDALGNIGVLPPTTWSAENGTINATTGLFTPWAVGVWNISANISGTIVNVTVNVTAGTLVSLTISPADTTITTDVTQLYSVNGFDAKGNPVAVNPASVTWDVQNGGIVGGLFTPDEVGIWAVYAVVNNIMGTTTVNVTIGVLIFEVDPASQTITADEDLQFTAMIHDALGNIGVLPPTTWSAENGTINATTGLFTPWAVGVWNISANISGTIVNVTVNVTAGTLVSLTISPADTTITTDVTQLYSASGTDAKGNSVTVSAASITWDAQDGSITVGGLYTPDKSGTWIIYAVTGNVMGSTSVVVQSGSVDSISITPTLVSLDADSTYQFTLTGYDTNGNLITGFGNSNVTWSATNGTTVNGLFTPWSTGTWTITATYGTLTPATATVIVTAGAVASIMISATGVGSGTRDSALTVGEYVFFTATGLDARDNAIPLVGVIWVSTIGTVSNGLFYAGTSPAIGTVTATYGAISSIENITVNVGPLHHIRVELPPDANPRVEVDDVRTLTANGYDIYGNEIQNLAFTWSADALIGTIEQDGTFRATNSGVGPVTATANGISGELSLFVPQSEFTGMFQNWLWLVLILAIIIAVLMILLLLGRREDEDTLIRDEEPPEEEEEAPRYLEEETASKVYEEEEVPLTEPDDMEIMECPTCDADVRADAPVCPECGEEFDNEELDDSIEEEMKDLDELDEQEDIPSTISADEEKNMICKDLLNNADVYDEDRKELQKAILTGVSTDEFNAHLNKAVAKKVEEEARIKECRSILSDADIYDEDRTELYKVVLEGITVKNFSKKVLEAVEKKKVAEEKKKEEYEKMSSDEKGVSLEDELAAELAALEDELGDDDDSDLEEKILKEIEDLEKL